MERSSEERDGNVSVSGEVGSNLRAHSVGNCRNGRRGTEPGPYHQGGYGWAGM